MRSLAAMMAVAMGVISFSTARADKEIKVGGLVFAEWFYDMSDTLAYSRSQTVYGTDDFDSYGLFRIGRAYLNARARMSEKTWGRVNFDVNPSNNYVWLKHAFIDWTFFKQEGIDLSTRLGLQGTPWINQMDATWGRRYVERTPSDQLAMQTSSDFGLSFGSNFGEKGKWGYARLALYNGTSYTSPSENNPTKDINLAVFIDPLNANPNLAETKVGFQIYSGTLNSYSDSGEVKDDFKKTMFSVMGNLQYRKIFGLGVEYDSYRSPQILDVLALADRGLYALPNFWPADTSDNSISVVTVFSTLWFEELAANTPLLKTTDLFFRFMMVDPDGDDHDLGGGINFETSATELIFGLECSPVDGVAASFNYRAERIKNVPNRIDDVSNSYLHLNMMLEF